MNVVPRLCLLVLGSSIAQGVAAGWLDDTAQGVHNIATQGSTDLFVPGLIWHDPKTYTADHRAVLNPYGIGIGFGKNLVDSNGDDDILYAMVFMDSHHNAEPIAGYARQWEFQGPAQLRFGAGYTLAVTSRADIFNNIPFPVLLPLVSVSMGRFSVFGTFIPRVSNKLNNGNVAFFFARYTFGD